MTTIGTAVLQVIPSLKGVTEAIQKQLDGQAIKVKVEPQVDSKVVEKAGKQVGKDIGKGVEDGLRSAPPTSGNGSILGDVIAGKPVSSNVRAQGQKVGKQVATGISEGIASGGGPKIDETITTSAKPKEAGRKIGKEVKTGIDESMQDAGEGPIEIIKGAAKDLGKEIAADVKAGDVQKAFGRVGDVVANTTRGVANISDVLGAHGVGDDIQQWGESIADTVGTAGAAIEPVVNKLRDTIDTLKQFKSGDITGGIAGTTDLLRGLVPDEHLDRVNQVTQGYSSARDTITGYTKDLHTLTGGEGSRTGDMIAAVGESAGPIAIAYAILDNIMPGWHDAKGSVIAQATGKKPFNAKDWFNTLVPGTNILDQVMGGPPAPPVQLTPREVADTSRMLLGAPGTPPVVHPQEGEKPIQTIERVITAAPAPAAVAPVVSGGGSNVQAQTASVSAGSASISVGSATVSGVSVPNPNASAPSLLKPGGGASLPPGFKSWYQTGGFTGDIPSDQIAGVVHGKEFVVQAAARKRIENLYPGLLDYLNNNGELPTSPVAAAASSGGGGPSIPQMAGSSGSSGSDLNLFSNAAESAVTGQLAALTGVSGTPGWLNAATTFLGGLSVSGPGGEKIFGGGSFGLGGLFSHIGSSGAGWPQGGPSLANVPAAGGGPSGPVFNTNISAFDTTDAVNAWQQKKNQITAAKLDSK